MASQMKKVVYVAVALTCTLLAGCATRTPEERFSMLQETIKPISNLSLGRFLARHYLQQANEVISVQIQASFDYYSRSELEKPRELLSAYCANNNGNLGRIPGHQSSWSEVAPESFSDPRSAGNAQLSFDSMRLSQAPGYGAAKASRNGAFGLFECRANNTDALLWAATIQGATGKVVRTGTGVEAVMPLTIRVAKGN
ncbi:hypothetical protein TMEC54S_00077 [Thauera mechernichensis]|uniref:hypothetical protein n=1 Tax=Zoogloea sp. TaxID=49181 RepID=UPI0026191A38|nr:hypothetical protein [Zoogloea sp.]MDD3354031.1 hypothetical protein [Zoogloea sp.]